MFVKPVIEKHVVKLKKYHRWSYLGHEDYLLQHLIPSNPNSFGHFIRLSLKKLFVLTLGHYLFFRLYENEFIYRPTGNHLWLRYMFFFSAEYVGFS